jgi:tetratricopeptide (TPR) repeat protein
MERVGHGAMAHVWRAVHRASGQTVALKVIKQLNVRPESQAFFRGLFGQEVRALARLDHPHIVRVYEHDTVPEGLDGLPAGAAYAVLEWLGDGSLKDHQGTLPWPQVQAHLLVLLDALAHAHARGVIHRDLKPGNVLLTDRGPVLTDFGVAVDLETGGLATEFVMGTPGYMAPEQVQGQWHRQGPWTDVYAIGCLAWALVCGRGPYSGLSPDDTLRAQMHEPLPAFEPRVAVPTGFEPWVRRMLAKPIPQRFAYAAQAAQALQGVQGPVVLGLLPAVTPPEADSTLVTTRPPEMIAAPERTPAPAGEPSVAGAGQPLPEHWQGAEPNPAPPLAGVGATLLGIRDVGLMGRARERDATWQVLTQVAQGDGPRLLLLDGMPGAGKRSLARWLAQRAHEVGGARSFRATHAAHPTPRCGVPAMLARALHCDGLDATERTIRVAEQLHASPLDELPQVLAAALEMRAEQRAPNDGSLSDGIRLESDREGMAALLDGLGALAGSQPAVVILEGLTWSAESVAFLRYALNAPESRAVLLIGVIDGEGHDSALTALEGVRAHPRATAVHVGRLTDASLAALVQALVPMDAEESVSMVRQADGDIGAAQAVARAYLRRGRRMPSVAVDVNAAWLEQLEETLPADDPASRIYEVAAVLGVNVNDGLWRAVLTRLGWAAAPEMHERLANAALVLSEETGQWRFVLPALVDALCARARARDRWALINGAFAAELDARPDVPAEQAAAHFAEAGDEAAALLRYETALQYRLERSTYDVAGRLLMAQAQLLRRMGQRPPHRMWITLRVRWSRVAEASGRLASAERWAAHAVDLARAVLDDEHLMDALLRQAAVVAKRHGTTTAWPHYWEARRLCHGRPEDARTVRVLTEAASAQARMGHLDEAGAMLERTLQMSQPRTRAQADVYRGLAMVEWQRGALTTARAHAEAASALYEQLGLRVRKAMALEVLADVARHAAAGDGLTPGALVEAQAWQREAVALLTRTGHEHRFAAVGGLGLCLLASGEYEGARSQLSESVEQASAWGHVRIGAIMGLHLVICEISQGEWVRAAGVLAVGTPLRDGVVVSADAALGARTLARLAEAAGQYEIADDAWAVALDQYIRLGRTDEYGDLAVEHALELELRA